MLGLGLGLHLWSNNRPPLRREYIIDNRLEPYEEEVIDSMVSPQTYSAGTYDYGYCVTQDDAGTINTYQVSNVEGTSEAPGHADWENLGTDVSFVPIATPAELDKVRTAQTAETFGAGSTWEGTYDTDGAAGFYIQVKDIDLTFDTQDPSGAFYNAGAGWEPIGRASPYFTGRFDGGGRVIEGVYINRTVDLGGIFARSREAVFVNITAVLFDMTITDNNCGSIIGLMEQGTIVSNCHSILCKITSKDAAGGIVGYNNAGLIIDCFSSSIVYATNRRAGGITGWQNINNTVEVKNCLNVGWVYSPSDAAGIDPSSGTETNSYYNSETVGLVGGKTTAELLSGEPSVDIYTDWDTNIWDFIDPTTYPVHKFFGLLAINLQPPKNLAITDETANWKATWERPELRPKGYNLYQSKDNGVWEKVNTALITKEQHTFTAPTDAGEYNYFVVGVYHNKPYNQDQSTGNSVTTMEEII